MKRTGADLYVAFFKLRYKGEWVILIRCFHIFKFLIRGQWHRSTVVYSEREFESIMDQLEWAMPYNMAAFHFNTDGERPVRSSNAVFNNYPIVDIDLCQLVIRRVGMKVGRGSSPPVAMWGKDRTYAILPNSDGYGRFVCLEARDEVVTADIYPLNWPTAKAFVGRHHRHNVAPQGHKFSIGLLDDGILLGVAIAAHPKAAAHDDGLTLEINRCCVLPEQPNACSKLMARVIRCGRAMGYRRFISYTLPSESGSSLKAVGFRLDGYTEASKGWSHPSRPRRKPERYPEGSKKRWLLVV